MRLLSSFVFLFAAVALPSPSVAEPAKTLGVGRLFTNDYLGDGRDRWQSGSYVVSTLRGPLDWMGEQQTFGAVLEYRLRGAIISSNGRGPAPGDRPYAGTVSLGVHSHWGQETRRYSLGVDLTVIGPQTGISDFQREAHDVLGLAQVPFTDEQLGNDFHFGITGEVAEVLPLGPATTLRPFAEVQIGPEDLIRVGADLFIGGDISHDILVRDVTTGHLYRSAEGVDEFGFSFVLGADIAAVGDSIYLPSNRGATLRRDRGRLRGGVQWQGGGNTTLFYGLTYLAPEFEEQSTGQLTGSVQLVFNF